MDNDDFRRATANHKVYGEAMAVLAGDALPNHGLRLISRPELAKGCIRQVRILQNWLTDPGSMGIIGRPGVRHPGRKSGH